MSTFRDVFLGISWGLLPWLVAVSVGCSSNEPLSEVEKARKIAQLRKQADEQLAIFQQSSGDPGGVDVDALLEYVRLQGETTRIAPATCPRCFAGYAAALSRLGLYYEELLRAYEEALETAPPDERPDMETKMERYREKMLESFRQSNNEFNKYYASCRRNNEPIDPETYIWVLRQCEKLKDYYRALHYLDLWVASVRLTPEQERSAERLRVSWEAEIQRLEEEKLRRELDNS